MSTRKRQADHTISDIIRLRPKWFMDKQSDPSATAKALNHILSIMELGQGHIASYLFFDVFGVWDISTAPLHEINKRIMEFNHEFKRTDSTGVVVSAPVTRTSLLTREDLRHSLAPSTGSFEDRIASLKTDIANTLNNIDHHNERIRAARQSIDDCLRIIANKRVEIEAFELKVEEGVTHTLDPEKLKILRDLPPQWIVSCMGQTTFTILRKTPITMNFINAATGMCRTLYMGYIGMEFHWTLQCGQSFVYADCIDTSTRTIHPHLRGGHICWGNMTARADRMRESGDVKGFFALLETLLTTYCPDQPFEKFDYFYHKRNTSYKAWKAPYGMNGDTARIVQRMVAQTASDRYLEWFTANSATSPNTSLMQKAKRCAQKVTDLWEDATRIKRAEFTAELTSENNRGEPLRLLLRKHGIHLPDKDFYLRHGFETPGVFSSIFNRLMLLCHGSMEIVRSAPHNVTERAFYEITPGHRYVMKEWVQYNIHMTQFTPASPNGRLTDQVQNTIRTVPRDAAPTDAITVTPVEMPAPVLEEEMDDDTPICDIEGHDYASDGYCQVCADYDSDFDESREEEPEEAPF
jgi:hypothetical protein